MGKSSPTQKKAKLEETNQMLEKRLRFLEQAFDNFPQQLWILSDEGDLVYTSKALRDVLQDTGWKEGSNFYAWLSNSPFRAVELMLRKHDDLARKSKVPIMVEETAADQDRTYLSYKAAFRTKDDPEKYLLGVSFDITERKETESFLLQSVNQMKLAEQTKRTFVQNFRHDLKTSLSNIIGAAECLSNIDMPNETQVWVESIRESSKHLLEHINELTSGLTKRKEPMPVKLTAVDLMHEVSVLESSFRTMSRAKKLGLKISFSDDFPKRLNLDVIRIRRVISNLMSNAFKYTHKGGVDLAIYYTRSSDGGLLEIHVEDTGVGIEQKFQEFIFSPLSRISGSRSSDGSGLGLAIVKEFVDDLKGQVSVKSQPGRGSTFVVMLPLIDR